ncbi:MAG: CNNM domain-containing protein [Planctomycetales bacterium]
MMESVPWFLAMVFLSIGSSFFSASEAAFFLLGLPDQKALAAGNRAQRLVASLLSNPDRLLTAILFWNLVLNVTYFAIVSIIALRWERQLHQPQWAGIFTLAALLYIIFFSELLPKSVAVLRPKWTAVLLVFPLAFLLRLVDPLLAIFHWATLLSRRLIWPHFEPEAYLEVADLERAVAVSTSDAALLRKEKTVLQNMVALSTVRLDEMMRPRIQFLSFRPPVSLADLEGRMTPSGYLLIADPENEEVVGAVPMKSIHSFPRDNLEKVAKRVFYMPWCASGSQALEQMLSRQLQVVAVVNEFGETVGILTFDDLLDSIFTTEASRSQRLLRQRSLRSLAKDCWQVTGMTTLRRLERRFQKTLPTTKNMTVGGVLQEMLGRMPEVGDACNWGPFHFRVIDVPDRGQMMLELTVIESAEADV